MPGMGSDSSVAKCLPWKPQDLSSILRIRAQKQNTAKTKQGKSQQNLDVLGLTPNLPNLFGKFWASERPHIKQKGWRYLMTAT